MIKQAAQQSCNVSIGNWFCGFSRHYFTPLCLSSITLLSPLIASLPISIFSWKLHAPFHCKKKKKKQEKMRKNCTHLLSPHSCWNERIVLPGPILANPSLYAGVHPYLPHPGASLVAQMAKNLPAIRSLGGKDPLEKSKATRSSILAWRIS